jgi:hypothetical protein
VAVVAQGDVHLVELATGAVEVVPDAVDLSDAFGCESYAFWGVLERFDDEDWLTYVGGGARLQRVRVSDGSKQIVKQFDDLGDTCSITLDTSTGRLLFHHELDSQFASAGEMLVSCPASLCMDDACACSANATLCDGACRLTDSDVDHCGACGVPCTGGAICSGVCMCDASLHDGMCGAACADFDGDDDTCGDCTTSCGATEDCVDGVCRDIPVHHVDALSTAGCVAIDLPSPPSGGLAVGDGYIYFGDDANGLHRVPELLFTAPEARGVRNDYLLTDVSDGSVWSLGCPGGCSVAVDATSIIEYDADGTVLQEHAIGMTIDDVGFSALFAGAGRSAVVNNGALYLIDHQTGHTVRTLLPLVDLPRPATCEEIVTVGVLERSGGDDFLIYITDGSDDVIRVALADGSYEVLLSADLGDSCALALSAARDDWIIVTSDGSELAPNPGSVPQLIACPATF